MNSLVAPKKRKKRTILIRDIKKAVEADTGIMDWDPVVMMAVIAARAFSGRAAIDDNGNPIIDENGDAVFMPPDLDLAVAAAAKVAPYLHQPLKAKEPNDSGESFNKINAHEKASEIAQRLGLTFDSKESGDDA